MSESPLFDPQSKQSAMIHRGEIPWGDGTLEYLEVTQMRDFYDFWGALMDLFCVSLKIQADTVEWKGGLKVRSSEIMGGSCNVLCDLGAYPSIPCHTLSLPWCVPTIPCHTLVCAHRPSSRLMPPSSHRRQPPVAHRELARTKLSPPHRAKIIQGPNS